MFRCPTQSQPQSNECTKSRGSIKTFKIVVENIVDETEDQRQENGARKGKKECAAGCDSRLTFRSNSSNVG